MRNRLLDFSLGPKHPNLNKYKRKRIEKKPESSNIYSGSEIFHLKCEWNRKTTSLRVRTWVLNCDINVLSVYSLIS